MFGKPPITALQEYCSKKKASIPKYECIDAGDGTKSFVCYVEALNQTSYGSGRSKQEAKHDAAANLIRDVRQSHPDICLIPQAPHETIPTTDAVMALRDICVQQNHPLPIFNIIQQSGPAEAPEFTVVCQLASIKRYGVANTKKAARQKAALEMLRIIQSASIRENNNQLKSLNTQIEETQENRYKKLKTYRELTESGSADKPGELLSDRHFFFEKFYDDIKAEAMKILADSTYLSEKDRVGDLFKKLKIMPKVKSIPMNTGRSHIFMELNLDYDVCFAGTELQIYGDITEYFKQMI